MVGPPEFVTPEKAPKLHGNTTPPIVALAEVKELLKGAEVHPILSTLFQVLQLKIDTPGPLYKGDDDVIVTSWFVGKDEV